MQGQTDMEDTITKLKAEKEAEKAENERMKKELVKVTAIKRKV